MMTRVVKQAGERRDEILDAAEHLLVTRGYTAMTTNDLLDAVGIARGTLYHHFASKEQVLDGLIRRHGDRVLARLHSIIGSDLPAIPKLVACFGAMAPQDADQTALVTELERIPDAASFLKTLDDLVLRVAPVIAEVVVEGVSTGAFTTAYPLEMTRMLLAASAALIDNPSLRLSDTERATQFAALLEASERLLGAPAGSLSAVAGLAGSAEHENHRNPESSDDEVAKHPR